MNLPAPIETPEREVGQAVLGEPRQLYRLGRRLSSTLIQLRGRFDGDLDQYLIYMVFVLSDLSRRLHARTGVSGPGPIPPRLAGLNALSVAEITEIPRETVRRKLRLLVASGHLRMEANRLYCLSEHRPVEECLGDFALLLGEIPAQP